MIPFGSQVEPEVNSVNISLLPLIDLLFILIIFLLFKYFNSLKNKNLGRGG